MCLGFPAKVIAVKNGTALVDILGVRREVDASLYNDLKPGEYVIVHAGMIISRIDESEFEETVRIFEELREVMAE